MKDENKSLADDLGTVSGLLQILKYIPVAGEGLGCECSCKINDWNNTRYVRKVFEVCCD